MRADPATVGDVFIDALAERIAQRIGERLDRHLEHYAHPVERTALSLGETAESLAISRSTVERLIEFGHLSTVTIGSRRLVPMDEVRRLGSHGVPSAVEGAK